MEYYNRNVDEEFFYCDTVDSEVLKGFYEYNSGKLHYLDSRMVGCGNELVEFYNSNNGEFVEFPTYCNNRSCLNEGCQEHRGILYKKNHFSQIQILKNTINKPKAWVFTTPRVDMPIDRSRLKFHMKRLVALMRKYSVTEFSVHMEIKYDRVRKVEGKRIVLPYDGKYYLHFHVVTGGLTDYRFVRTIWKHNVFYEVAISRSGVADYISKYASKVPSLPNEFCHHVYMVACYKLQMHKFSCGKSVDDLPYVSGFYMVDQLIDECNKVSKYNHSEHFDSMRDRPPDDVMNRRYKDLGINPDDVPACVYVHPNRKVKL